MQMWSAKHAKPAARKQQLWTPSKITRGASSVFLSAPVSPRPSGIRTRQTGKYNGEELCDCAKFTDSPSRNIEIRNGKRAADCVASSGIVGTTSRRRDERPGGHYINNHRTCYKEAPESSSFGTSRRREDY